MYILSRSDSSSEFDFNRTLENVLRWIQTALVATKDFLVTFFRDQGVFFIVLTVIGFGVSGIVGGSPAALYQSFCYGGHTPAASVFACLQSTGMSYNGFTVSNVVLVIIRVLAGLVAVYMILSMI
ncbi:uncharacterized protein EV420DRAFT_1528769 [Desarmillaria tabescens]|uniref:Uncharacterized protein n=1 Tax=Armillaria tabescens TaxID=1929756 RepID=A0AA39NAI7_ARMTA|nr:uncharacterized protein EV420DRAFT_1528769 [Desarmillaria tabescens]KAK0462076.1 hypothetical protein EV420DRAFT_1528769 [Desarmillaria tabescens]